jgi:signal transduction histidine kinase
MPEGGQLSITTGVTTLGEVDLRANPEATPGRFVSVSVQDNGRGMTAEVLAQVFQPFFTTKEIGKGSGLGLSQVHGFARQSGGHGTYTASPARAPLWRFTFPWRSECHRDVSAHPRTPDSINPPNNDRG